MVVSVYSKVMVLAAICHCILFISFAGVSHMKSIIGSDETLSTVVGLLTTHMVLHALSSLTKYT